MSNSGSVSRVMDRILETLYEVNIVPDEASIVVVLVKVYRKH
jgi:hypothetical protein